MTQDLRTKKKRAKSRRRHAIKKSKQADETRRRMEQAWDNMAKAEGRSRRPDQRSAPTEPEEKAQGQETLEVA